MATFTAIASAYTLGYGADITNPTNAYSDTSDSTYAKISGTDSESRGLLYLRGFSFSSIPDGSIVNSVIFKIKARQYTGFMPQNNNVIIKDGSYNVIGTFAFSSNDGLTTKTLTKIDITLAVLKSYIQISFEAIYGTGNEFYLYGIEIVVDYTPPTHAITSSAGANGSISPSGTVNVNSGSSQTFTITPNTGYEVDTLTVDGSTVTAATSYTFTNVTTTHSISVTFKSSYDVKKFFHEQLNQQLFGGI